MRTTISVISIIASIGLGIYILSKGALLTVTYAVGFACCIGMAFFSGYLITSFETGALKDLADSWKTKYEELLEEYERGKASAANS